MSNQTIGISGVFALTFLLFVLRHWFLSWGRPNSGRNVNSMNLRKDHESSSNSAGDNAWLWWTPDIDHRGGASKPRFGQHRGNRPF